jgi:hypothetical protein
MKKLNAFFLGLALSLASLGARALDLTNFAENKVVDALFRGQALGAPATWHIALDTVACTEAGGGTEVTGGSYARVAVAASLANWAGTQSAGSTVVSSGTGGTTSNNAVITFPTPTAGWGKEFLKSLNDSADILVSFSSAPGITVVPQTTVGNVVPKGILLFRVSGGTLDQEYLIRAMLRTVQGREEPVEVKIKVVAD